MKKKREKKKKKKKRAPGTWKHIADFGCGDARLSRSVKKTQRVHSFDLVAHNDSVTACDMARVPLRWGVSLVQCRRKSGLNNTLHSDPFLARSRTYITFPLRKRCKRTP